MGRWDSGPAVRDAWPETREQRDWVHRIDIVLDKLPKRLQSKTKKALRVMYAPTRKAAERWIDHFQADYGEKYPKAVTSLRRDQDTLLTFFDFPAGHWKHIRTSNPNESTFAENSSNAKTPMTGRPPPGSCPNPQLLTISRGSYGQFVRLPRTFFHALPEPLLPGSPIRGTAVAKCWSAAELTLDI